MMDVSKLSHRANGLSAVLNRKFSSDRFFIVEPAKNASWLREVRLVVISAVLQRLLIRPHTHIRSAANSIISAIL